jgi:hypothetical protein
MGRLLSQEELFSFVALILSSSKFDEACLLLVFDNKVLPKVI